MLWNSQVLNILNRTYQGAILTGTEARKAEATKRLQYYNDEQLEYLEAQIIQTFADPSKITPVFVNVTRKIINNIARVYSYQVKREVQGTDKDIEIFKGIMESSALPRKLKLASRYTKLLRTILIRPVWRNDKIDLDILCPDILDVETGDVPEDLLSVKITHFPESGKREEIEYSLWTPEQYQRLDYKDNVIESQDNPYEILPFVPCFARTPTDSFWIDGGDDLITCQDAINERLTDLCYVLRLQGFGQPWIKGLDGLHEVFLGPGRAMTLPKDGEMGFAATEAPITEIIESIKFLMTELALSYGLSAHLLVSEPSQESGISKIVSSQELDEIREDDKLLFTGYEHALFNTIRVIWNTHNATKKISEKATLTIEFRDPKPQVEPYQQSVAYQNLESMGVISAVDILMERNPDIKTREQAMEHLRRVEKERSELNGMPLELRTIVPGEEE